MHVECIYPHEFESRNWWVRKPAPSSEITAPNPQK